MTLDYSQARQLVDVAIATESDVPAALVAVLLAELDRREAAVLEQQRLAELNGAT